MACRYLILGTHQLSLKAFEGAMKYLGETDMDADEVQCIAANLIEKVQSFLLQLVYICMLSKC